MLLPLPLLLVAAAAAAAQDGDYDSDELSNDLQYHHSAYGSRMAGATAVATTDTTFSYVVEIKPSRSSSSNAPQPPSCAGILINGLVANTARPYVITSASCALAGDLLFITAGSVRNNTGNFQTEAVNASSVIVHEEFLRNMQTADIAAIPLGGTTITIGTTGSITAARLPSISSLTSFNRGYLKRDVIMAGWGYVNNVFLQNTGSLQSVSSWVVFNWYCRLRHLGLTIRATHLCTSGFPNKGPCTGDSGAPLMLRSGNDAGTVIGLATYVPNNGCNRGRPGVFTRIANYLAWIQDNTGFVPAD